MAYFKSYANKNPSLVKPTSPVVNQPTPIPVPQTPPPTSIPTPPLAPAKRNSGGFLRKVFNPWVLIGIILVTSLAVGGFLVLTGKFNVGGLVLGAKTTDETTKTLNAVGKLIILPSGEKPTIANITNVDQLKVRQHFFDTAQNGDKLIVYTNKVIIYRPKDNKIVDMSPVNLKNDLLSPTPTTGSGQNILNP